MNRPVAPLLERYLPSFCWMTVFEILLMLEVHDEDVRYETIRSVLTRMTEGACPRIERRYVRISHIVDRRGPKTICLFRFNPAFERAPSPRRGAQSHAKVIELIEKSNPAPRLRPEYNPRSAFSSSPAPAHRSSKFSGADALAT